MKRDNVKQILTLLKTGYPQSFTAYNAQSGELLLDIWYEGLKDLPSSLVLKAVKSIMLDDSREFAPNIGQVRRRIADMVTELPEVETENAWLEVKKILPKLLCLEGYSKEDAEHDKALYDKLSDETKRIYSLRELYTLCNQDPNDNDVYEKNKFRTAYRSIRQQTIDHAISTGNLLAVANRERLKELGLSADVLEIEMKEGK